MVQKLFLSRREAAVAIGLSLRTIDTLVATKQLLVKRVGRRVLIPIAEIEKFARKNGFVPTVCSHASQNEQADE